MKGLQRDSLNEISLTAVGRILGPLSEFIIENGISVQELEVLIREHLIKNAARRVLRETGRNNVSRIAIITGLSRTEVSTVLKRSGNSKLDDMQARNPAQRVLSAWFDKPAFLSRTGEPAILPIYGGGKTFEKLVLQFGGGSPTRAMLDELLRNKSIEILPGQKLKAMTRIHVSRGLSAATIESLGHRVGDLFSTLLGNLFECTPLFEATSDSTEIGVESLPLLKREVAARGSSFIGNIEKLVSGLGRSSRGSGMNAIRYRAGVTVFYFEHEIRGEKTEAPVRRRNLKRVNPRNSNVGHH